MNKILLITNRYKDIELYTTKRVLEYLAAKGVECRNILVDRRTGSIDPLLLSETEGAVILGGDGTIMQFAHELSKADIPILGINMGHMGYLAEADGRNAEAALERVLAGEYHILERMMIEGEVKRDGKVIYQQTALNDVVITRSGRLQVLNFNIYINGNLLKNYNADGMILSTPTGSTAYNLSAGGPIADPKAEILIFTPISPHTLMNRSLVLKATDYVEIEILATHEDETEELMEADFDGKEALKLSKGDRVSVTRSDKHVKMICLNEVSFMETLHRKMKES